MNINKLWIAAVLFATPSWAQQQAPSPELTALAVSAWVSQVAQANAELRNQVAALQVELAKAKMSAPAGALPAASAPVSPPGSAPVSEAK